MPFVFSQRGGAYHLLYKEAPWKLLIWFLNVAGASLLSPVSPRVPHPCQSELWATSAPPHSQVPPPPSLEPRVSLPVPALGTSIFCSGSSRSGSPIAPRQVLMDGRLRFVAGGRNASLCWHHLELVTYVCEKTEWGTSHKQALIFLMSLCPKPSVIGDFVSQPDFQRKALNSSEVERGEPRLSVKMWFRHRLCLPFLTN